MGLDLTVVAAQIVNFLVLVVLLNRFLYRPVVRIMAAREERVRRRLEEAEALEMQAKAEIAAYQAQQEELRRERARLLEEAREEARQERARLLEEAARDTKRPGAVWGSVALERAELEASIKEGLVRQVCEAAGYVLGELAGTSLEDAVIATLERRWEGQERERPARPYPPPAGSTATLFAAGRGGSAPASCRRTGSGQLGGTGAADRPPYLRPGASTPPPGARLGPGGSRVAAGGRSAMGRDVGVVDERGTCWKTCSGTPLPLPGPGRGKGGARPCRGPRRGGRGGCGCSGQRLNRPSRL